MATLREQAGADSEDPSIIGRLARAELDEGYVDRALFAARRALELDSDQREALAALGGALVAYAKAAQDESASRAYEDEARPVLERLHRLDPLGWTAPRLLAEIALHQERTDDAIRWYTRLQSLCPADPASRRGLAGIYLRQLRYDRALPQLVELARLEQTDPDVPAQIGDIHRARERLSEARYWYTQAVYIDPYDVRAHRALAELAAQSGDTRTALSEFTLLTKLEPDHAENFEKAAFAARDVGDIASAQSLAQSAVRLDPGSSARSLLP